MLLRNTTGQGGPVWRNLPNCARWVAARLAKRGATRRTIWQIILHVELRPGVAITSTGMHPGSPDVSFRSVIPRDQSDAPQEIISPLSL